MNAGRHLRRFLVAAGSAAAITVAAQTPQPPPQPPRPTFRTEANFVRVDAYPTRDGSPVHDLTRADFEVLENGVLQSIDTFEEVRVGAPGPQSERIEPNSVRESRAMAADPRARVFVVFLDTYHVDFGGSHRSREPIVQLLDRVIGQDDLVAVMTPEMAATDITFARRTQTIEAMLARYWTWGRRDSNVDVDPQEWECLGEARSAVALELKRRRREKLTLDAMTDLVVHLRGLREERKAILAFTGGWTLPRPDASLMPKPRGGVAPGMPPPVRVGIDGRLTTGDTGRGDRDPRYACEALQMQIAQLDLYQTFRDLLETANYGNATFYPINPAGLEAGVTPADIDWIKQRTDALLTLADDTDGIAVVNTNNLTASIRRVVDDLSSYYLIGYYSSNPKLDGSFRSITVRVRLPGVSVRARRGYRAARAEEITASRAGAAPTSAIDESIRKAVSAVSAASRPSPLRVAAAASLDGTSVSVAGEFDAAALRDQFRAGADAVVLISEANGSTLGQAKLTVPPGRRSFSTEIKGLALKAVSYDVMVRASAPSVTPVTETSRIEIDSTARVGSPVLSRRASPSQAFERAADPRFRRNETLRVLAELREPASDGRIAVSDSNGRSISLSVDVRVVEEGGRRWLAAELSLASFSPATYVIQLTAADGKGTIAFSVIP